MQSDLRWPSSRLIAGVRFTVEGAGVAPLETADRSVPPWNRRLSLSHQVWPKAPHREAEDEPRPSAKAERLGTHDASVPCRALTRALTKWTEVDCKWIELPRAQHWIALVPAGPTSGPLPVQSTSPWGASPNEVDRKWTGSGPKWTEVGVRLAHRGLDRDKLTLFRLEDDLEDAGLAG